MKVKIGWLMFSTRVAFMASVRVKFRSTVMFMFVVKFRIIVTVRVSVSVRLGITFWLCLRLGLGLLDFV